MMSEIECSLRSRLVRQKFSRGAVAVGVYQSMCSSILTLPLRLLQEEGKLLSTQCHCVLTIGLLNLIPIYLSCGWIEKYSANLTCRTLIFRAVLCALCLWLFVKLFFYLMFIFVHWIACLFCRSHNAVWWNYELGLTMITPVYSRMGVHVEQLLITNNSNK